VTSALGVAAFPEAAVGEGLVGGRVGAPTRPSARQEPRRDARPRARQGRILR
jgi:hypothetical protein